tara:strand:+ start:229 stop:945 length:717 start_codon:yes stop_codon:yes gene_type:complete
MNKNKKKNNSLVVGFDADDTLWENENIFYETQIKFKNILKNYADFSEKEFIKIEKENLNYYGYGVKGFILSLIEASIKISDKKIEADIIEKFLNLGKKMLNHPLKVLPNVEDILKQLSEQYFLLLITKGDLFDQEKKIYKSNLAHYFDHIEIVSEKNNSSYKKILRKYDIDPKKFLMVGNSIKSDIIPVNNIGGKAIYIPFSHTWEHEITDTEYISDDYVQLDDISLIIPFIKKLLKT